ncbi:MAG: nodulation protein NfeD [Chloroflexi bacterium]|nr:nodulation protein NfeD [Chloroflexota bacterium]
MKVFRVLWLAQIVFWIIALLFASVARADEGHVDVLRVDGIINPVVAGYVDRGISTAERDGARALVIEMNTPGGLDTSMRAIIFRILNAQLPVIVYVYPSGSRAASAGAFIMQSAHVAAMAPNTSMGSAHPVLMGQSQPGQDESPRPDDDMIAKVTNDAVSYIKGLADIRGRNVEWAERMVRESVNATEKESLDLNAIDIVADDIPSLLAQADGRQVKLAAGMVPVQTANARIVRLDMNFIEQFLHIISDPNIAYILLFLGTNAIIYELASPGSILPGVVGVISLLLAFYSLGTLPVNYVGLALIVFAFILFIAEIKVQSSGVLLGGGILAMVLGSMIMMNTDAPYLSVPWTTIAGAVGGTSLFFIFVVGKARAALQRQAVTGREGLIGAIGEAKTDLAPEGTVLLQGERWSALCEDGQIPAGTRVRVVGLQGFTLLVRKA